MEEVEAVVLAEVEEEEAVEAGAASAVGEEDLAALEEEAAEVEDLAAEEEALAVVEGEEVAVGAATVLAEGAGVDETVSEAETGAEVNTYKNNIDVCMNTKQWLISVHMMDVQFLFM